jgi:hypothetical protein
METKTKGIDLVEHWNWAAEKGLMKKNTAASLRSACSKVLSALDDWESVDITAIDIDDTILRFKNIFAKNYQPKSLNVYGNRFKKAIDSYLGYIKDPSAWKPTSRQIQPSNRNNSNNTVSPAITQIKEMEQSQPTNRDRGLIDYPFPLRDGVTVKLMLPRDITMSEVKRLNAFMSTLTVDFNE